MPKRSQLARSLKSHARAPALNDFLAEAREAVVGALDNLKGLDIVVINLSGKAAFADLMVIASGTSSRHMASLADAVVEALRQTGLPAQGVEGRDSAGWVCVDAGDIVVHLFTPDSRAHYRLEKLWSFPSLV